MYAWKGSEFSINWCVTIIIIVVHYDDWYVTGYSIYIIYMA